MSDCIPSKLLPYSSIGLRYPCFTTWIHWTPHTTVPIIQPTGTTNRNGRSHFLGNSFGSSYARNMNIKKSTNYSIRVGQNSTASGSDEYELYGESRLKDKDERGIELETGVIGDQELKQNLNWKRGQDFIEFNEGYGRKTATFSSSKVKAKGHEDLIKVRIDDDDGDGLKLGQLESTSTSNSNSTSTSTSTSNILMSGRRRRQTVTRSNMIAKQVISIQSALSLGFVSQLWVDTTSWMVLVIEVRPSLLSGKLERFLLEDISQVGDVVLIQEESAMENDIKMVGLETLVGYNVVTPGRRNIGKVRGYTFNINSGAVESLELDSFGISIIPSSLVSTYALFVEDVLEVVFDTVVVHEAAASRIQRLTKGFWDGQKVVNSMDEIAKYSDLETSVEPDYGGCRRRRRSSSEDEEPNTKMGEMTEDWELPMDYL